jgi:hypothetical protein
MENNENAQETAVKSAAAQAPMINPATLMLKPEDANLAIQEHITDSPSTSTNAMLPVISEPLVANGESKTAPSPIEPENIEFSESLTQNATNNRLLAEQCKKALEKSYGCTIPIPADFLKRRIGMNRK